MVEVKHLTKCYGDIKAVDDISFTVETGEVLGFLGPNGAGKSTTMNMITGYISSTSGTVTIDGSEILDNPKETKKKIGYLPEIPPLYVDMTVRKYLEFMFDLKKVKLPKKEHIEEVMRLVRISEQSERIIKNLSKGYRQRVGFAQALLGNPPVLILDEPTVGLDPKQIIEIRKLIKSLGKKHTVIFSSHVLSEISATCDRIIVISNGKIVADAKTEELSTAVSGEEKLSLEIEGASADVISAIKKIPAVIRANKVKTMRDNTAKYLVEYEKGVDIRRDVFSAMARIGCPILNMQSGNETLEDMFLKLTTSDQNNYRENGGNS
ncbi:ATP-binding cassette domain-containing protein [Ruminococcus sp.]|uniref:ABC transporter ATP-binding protein n=1 Tax=Ruminococcus sp. TaxID=41978 RepID=UPI0025DC45D3|nr:ATP-binding cassette domain-containing protein [Ruminococcus sp.]MCI6615885.1 ABC transporter ATP-binding protein [Ruminococcus sp.]